MISLESCNCPLWTPNGLEDTSETGRCFKNNGKFISVDWLRTSLERRPDWTFYCERLVIAQSCTGSAQRMWNSLAKVPARCNLHLSVPSGDCRYKVERKCSKPAAFTEGVNLTPAYRSSLTARGLWPFGDGVELHYTGILFYLATVSNHFLSASLTSHNLTGAC